ncbi:hypothetical protein [Aeoliella sp.]|uniref:hypothetical protein n=1 Tax=Aeoliella sp. TaxID=2795800 RepID=UPI003CCC3A30
MPELLFIVVPIIIVVFCLLAYYSHLQAKKRREALAAWAQQRGWRFAPGHDSRWDRRYSQFSCFTQGHSRYAYNLLDGALQLGGESRPCTVGDYTYKVTSGSGKNRRTTTYSFSFLLVELPYVGLPQLAVRPEGFFDGLASLVGFDDIDFESEEFSRKFHVKSSDKRFAYDLLHPRMMEFMLASAPPTFEIERGVFCLQGANSCWELSEIEQEVNWCKHWFGLWPPHLLADLQSRSAN